jgi:4-hydroxy-tetrahydrodipicolinate synthase
MTKELRGVLTALSTPFNQDETIDVATLRKIVDRSIDAGVDGVVAAGSTGEVGALSSEERLLLIKTVIEHTNGRVPVIANTGATATAEAIRLSKAAEQLGADVLMLITPYYEPLSLEETVTYIKDVASAVSIPVMLYNIPAVTGVNLDPATVRALAEEVENILYIKDSSANWEQALQLIHHHSALVEGSAGVMAGTANVVPEEIVAVAKRIADGDLAGARELWNAVYPVIDALLTVAFIPAVKAGLTLQGLPAGSPRRPTAGLDADDLAKVEQALAKLSSIKQNIG